MGTIYDNYLTNQLQAKVVAIKEHGQTMLYTLEDEIAVTQEFVGRSIIYANKVIDSLTEDMPPLARLKIFEAARGCVDSAIERVKALKEAHKKLQEKNRGMDIVYVNNMLATLSENLVQAVPPQLREHVVSQIEMHTKAIENNSVPMTLLTPERLDREVQAMIDSVPDYEESTTVAVA